VAHRRGQRKNFRQERGAGVQQIQAVEKELE
jgi:hypothetical protein